MSSIVTYLLFPFLRRMCSIDIFNRNIFKHNCTDLLFLVLLRMCSIVTDLLLPVLLRMCSIVKGLL